MPLTRAQKRSVFEMSELATTPINPEQYTPQPSRDALAMKAIRLLKNLSRKEAGKLCNVSARAFEQLENGRSVMSNARIERYVTALGSDMTEFVDVRKKVLSILSDLKSKQEKKKEEKAPRKIRRYLLKLITKEARVLRVLRKRKNISQDQASLMCGYGRCVIGNLENGRINLTEKRIAHILKCLGFYRADFDELLNAEVLRDEILDECAGYLESLEDTKLESAQTVIKALLK